MTFLKRIFLLFLLVLPAAAFAGTIYPVGGGNAWALHVMGNGSTIASVLESIKMIINPQFGGGSFKLLLLFMATTGFCILAIQAGFNPSQNLFKMFGYVLVVWLVTYSCTTLNVNVMVRDKVTQKDYVVTDVPAIVGLPASIVSEVGNWMTTNIQQAYSTPDAFSLTNGGFNLFNKMRQDLDDIVITDQNLKQSLSAYIADCAVNAMALGNLRADELMTSSNLWGSRGADVNSSKGLGRAASDVALTKYFTAASISAADGSRSGTTSTVMTCNKAYQNLTTDLEEHASQMLAASAKQWAGTGTMVPYETVQQAWMEAAHMGASSGTGGGAYSKPTGVMLQKSLINTMAGDFRQAAVQSGNNEVLMGQAISQAEQSQKSGWVTSAIIFQNMMGYVYTTLQAFIFAIVPIMIVALMIPGLGKKIFVNYGQILIWLTLWEPMLSIVNYLVTLFGMQDMQTLMATGNSGFNMRNNWIITEQGNNLTIAAQFLATMVPLLCWGLVNGAMAFTEFISHGIGSSFAMQAGAQAATGNVSLNSMGMNSLSSNKFDNSSKATVGNQAAMAFENAGGILAVNDRAGQMVSQNASAISSGFKFDQAKTSGVSDSKSASQTTSGKNSDNMHDGRGNRTEAGNSTTANTGTVISAGDTRTLSAAHNEKAADKVGSGSSVGTGQNTAAAQNQMVDAGLRGELKFGKGGGGGAGGSGSGGGNGSGSGGGVVPTIGSTGINGSRSIAQNNSSALTANSGLTGSRSNDFNRENSMNDQAQRATGRTDTSGLTHQQTGGSSSFNDRGAQRGHGGEDAYQTGRSMSYNTGTSESFAKSLQWGSGVTDDDIRRAEAMEGTDVSIQAQMAQMQSFYGDTHAQALRERGIAQGAYGGLSGAGMAGGLTLNESFAGAGPNMSLLGAMPGAIENGKNIVNGGVATVSNNAGSIMRSTHDGATRMTSNLQVGERRADGTYGLTGSHMAHWVTGTLVGASAWNVGAGIANNAINKTPTGRVANIANKLWGD